MQIPVANDTVSEHFSVVLSMTISLAGVMLSLLQTMLL